MKKLLWCGVAAVGVAVGPVLADEAAAPAAGKVDGKALYDGKCAVCHGKDGKAEGPMGKKLGIKDLTDAKYQATLTDEGISKVIKEGLTKDGKNLMKPFDQLTADELKALVAYTRAFAKKEGEAAKPAEAAQPAAP